MNREEIIRAIEQHRIIVIARGLSREELLKTAEAMYRGGIRLMEVTFNACGDPSDEETASNIAMLAEHFKGKMYIGAGTVLRPAQVDLAAKSGAAYIISPDSRREVIERTRELGLVSLPGAFTPTECTTAWDYGADFIKIFPNSEMKPSYIKALKAPLSHIRFLAAWIWTICRTTWQQAPAASVSPPVLSISRWSRRATMTASPSWHAAILKKWLLAERSK